MSEGFGRVVKVTHNVWWEADSIWDEWRRILTPKAKSLIFLEDGSVIERFDPKSNIPPLVWIDVGDIIRLNNNGSISKIESLR